MKTNYSEQNPKRCETCKHSKWEYFAWGTLCVEDGTKIPESGTVAGPGIGESTVVDWEQNKRMREWIKEHEVEKTGFCDDYSPND